MTTSTALVPRILEQTPNQSKVARETLTLLSGIALMALLSQISVPLPFTPVPITGQTLGALLIALTFGRKRAPAIVGAYLAAGLAGLPVFAAAPFGPTSGYLLGMFAASFVVGALADRGATRTFGRALGTALVGQAVIYALGLAMLSFFVPARSLLVMGLLPFLAGDLVKAALAAGVSSGLSRKAA